MVDKKKTYKTFKEYYANPEFRKRHTEYINQTVHCDACNKPIKRFNIARHSRTQKHQKNLISNPSAVNRIQSLEDKIEELQNQLQTLK